MVTFRHVLRAALLAQLCACASVEMLPEDYETPSPLPRSYLAQFCYQPAPLDDEMVLIKEKKAYRVFEGSINAGLDGYDDDSRITFEFYEPAGNGRSPVVLLLPILNGQKHVMRPFATKFVKNGYAAVIVDTVQRRTLLDDLDDPEAAIRLTIQRHRRVIDWIETRPDFDASRLGVFGASLGGFNALFLAAVDPRVSVVSPALVGGSLPYILVNSNERRIVEATDAMKTRLSMDDEQLMDYLTGKIETDTLTVAPHVNAERVMMILTRYDKTVPYDSQLRLRAAMGYPEAITLPTGHNTAAAYLFYLRSRVLRFFDRTLLEAGGRGTAAMPDDICDEALEKNP
jgi:pimeloyl-ACP methyl ester carboxylesterase